MSIEVVSKCGSDELAVVFVARLKRNGAFIEFVESVQPPLSREEKWVLIISTLQGCPVECRMCDAGGWYHGTLDVEELAAQVEYMVRRRYPSGHVPAAKFKIQFSRMGEPAFNDAVLDLLAQLPGRYSAHGLMPGLSTIAPRGRGTFFSRLADIKNEHYSGGLFQLQFSIHSTRDEVRDWLMPIPKWDLSEVAAFGERFWQAGDRRIALSFALTVNHPVEPEVIERLFDPQQFMIKATPLNPTLSAQHNGLESAIAAGEKYDASWMECLRAKGYEVILSIGQWEENRIGSNCGQYVRRFIESGQHLHGAYDYAVSPLSSLPSRNQKA